jgi:regulator of extracellular matrix RemA (YlzA/DUF370 family)
MNLTQNMKKAILRSIMDDVPSVSLTEDEAQRMLYNAMSEPIKRIYDTNKNALRVQSIYGVVGDYTRTLVIGDANPNQVFSDIIKKQEARWKAEQDLKGVINQCRTLKQLEKALPEFASYFPKPEEKLANLPATLAVSALVSLGWPSGKPKETNQ